MLPLYPHDVLDIVYSFCTIKEVLVCQSTCVTMTSSTESLTYWKCFSPSVRYRSEMVIFYGHYQTLYRQMIKYYLLSNPLLHQLLELVKCESIKVIVPPGSLEVLLAMTSLDFQIPNILEGVIDGELLLRISSQWFDLIRLLDLLLYPNLLSYTFFVFDDYGFNWKDKFSLITRLHFSIDNWLLLDSFLFKKTLLCI